MDQCLKWEQLTLMQQLNCACDTLAKKSITTAIIHGYHDRQSQLLPKEDVALVIWGTKITGNILPPLQFHACKEVARKYLATCKKDKWSNRCFDVMDWEHLDLALKNKADMYKCGGPSNIWVSAVQGFRLAVTPVSCFLMSNAHIADNGRQRHTSCSALMMTAPDYWLKMLTN